MTTSTNEDDSKSLAQHSMNVIKGAIADALTLVRICLTPVIMFIIVKAWSAKPGDFDGFVSLDMKLVLLASILFVIAAVTDILDDLIGGGSHISTRLLGWLDDIADSFLILGTLLSLVWVVGKADLLHWSFAAPVLILVLRDIFIGLVKSYKFSKYEFQETRLGDVKSALAMLAVCILVAAPWLSNLLDSFLVSRTEDISHVYNSAITMVWNTGLGVLWVAAILAIYTGKKKLTKKAATLED